MAEDKRIHVLHYGLSKHLGGIEANLKKITDGIDSQLFKFSFIDMAKAQVCFYSDLSEKGCEFYEITPRRDSLIRNRMDIIRLFKNNKFDIFHYHINTLSYIFPIEIALKYGVKVVIHSRSAGMVGSLPTKVLHNINKYKIRRLKSKVNRLAVSKQAAVWLFGEKNDCQVLRNGIDLSRFSFSQDVRDKVRKELSISSDTFLLGNVSSFTQAKNHKFLVRVFHRLVKDNPDLKFKLCLVGDGVMKNEIIDLVIDLGISEHVFFLGRASEVEKIYSALDLFLFPSLFEGFGNVMIEAQACGLMCVTSDKVPCETFVDDSLIRVVGLEEGSEKEWCDCVCESLLNNENEKNLGFDRSSANALVDYAGLSKEKEIMYLQSFYFSLLKI